jgi:hypothetical protein
MKLQTIAKITLAATALASRVAAQAAGPAGTPAGAKSPGVQPQAVGPKKLLSTYIGSGNGNGASLPQFAYTTIDSATVNCKNTGGCTIGIETMAQIKPQGGDWAICLTVDGTNTSCQYQGIQGSTTGYVVGNARGVRTGVTFGNHAVTTQIYVEGAGAVYAYFQSDYRVYKP